MKIPDHVTDIKVGRKTPDEIKKWLEYCHSSKPCIDCKYDQRDFPHCVRRLLADAINGYEKLEASLAQVERERDAMHRDMKLYSRCKACKKFADGQDCPVHTECTYGGKALFEWRGVCPENTKED